jgi:hypothetical protein
MTGIGPGQASRAAPDGLSLFEPRRREAADTAIVYAFDLIEHDGEDMRNLRKNALARLLGNSEAGILFNEHIVEDSRRLRARLPAWRRGHRVKEGRKHVSIWPVPRLDQGPQSAQHRRAAGAQRDLESTISRQRTLTMTAVRAKSSLRGTIN